MADRCHKYVGEKKGVALHLKNGKTLFDPSVGKLNYFSGFRRPLDSSNPALATIATGKIPSVSPVDIDTFHTSRGHVHEKSLRPTAKQLGGILEGSLRKREGCSVAKGLGKPIGRTTSTRADKVLFNSGRVVHSRNDTWARLPSSVSVSAENVRSVSVSRKGRKLDPSHHGDVKWMRMWIVMSQAITLAFDRESLHARLLRLPRLSHAGGLHRRAVEVPPRLPR